MQRTYFTELKELQKEYQSGKESFPILIAGDIFDYWNTPPELLNFAMSVIPKGTYAISGNHETPYHNHHMMEKSGFQCLVNAGAIREIDGYKKLYGNGIPFGVFGMKWGEFRTPPKNVIDPGVLNVALIHDYCWIKKHTFPNAPPMHEAKEYAKALKGFEVGIFGDNHSPFQIDYLIAGASVLIYNCGNFIRRGQDEIKNKPSIGILMSDGTMKRHYLKSAESDRFIPKTSKLLQPKSENVEELVAIFRKAKSTYVDFAAMCMKYMMQTGVPQDVINTVSQIIEESK